MSHRIISEMVQVPSKPYEKTELYHDSIRLKQIMYHIVNNELDRRARYRQGADLAANCDNICRALIHIYMFDNNEKLAYVKVLLEQATNAMITLRAIDNDYVHMTKESYTAMLGILVKYVAACKNIMGIAW